MSGEKKWTAGPWARGENYSSPEHCERIYACDPGPENDFTIGYARDVYAPTRMANAHLIAVAPEMYNQLDRVRVALMCWYPKSEIRDELIEEILELLAKARGEK